MKFEDLIRIRHMLDAIKEALAFTRDKSREDLNDNRMLTLAIIKELENISEAASKLTPEFKVEQPHIPWTDIIGMRNRLTHGYFDGIEYTVTGIPPPLRIECRQEPDISVLTKVYRR